MHQRRRKLAVVDKEVADLISMWEEAPGLVKTMPLWSGRFRFPAWTGPSGIQGCQLTKQGLVNPRLKESSGAGSSAELIPSDVSTPCQGNSELLSSRRFLGCNPSFRRNLQDKGAGVAAVALDHPRFCIWWTVISNIYLININ